jgi:hypothetical protein
MTGQVSFAYLKRAESAVTALNIVILDAVMDRIAPENWIIFLAINYFPVAANIA